MANGFFKARPHFENRQMVQWMGESIHLSGQTNFELGGFNSYIYDSYEDFLNGVSGATFLSLPLSAATDPISGWSNQTVFQPGIVRVIPPHAVFFSGNTNIISATTQEDVTNYIATSFDSQGTIVWKPLSGLTSMSGSCTPDFYVGTIHPCGTGGTVTIQGNLLVRGDTISATTIIETETILVEDNNIEMNYGGDHTTALGGGITVLSGASNTPAAFGFTDSTISTDGIGTWVLNTGLDVGNQTPYSVPHKSIGVGENNIVGAEWSAVIGRDHELNKGFYSTILGGRSNYMRQPPNSTDDGGFATIMGGSGHTLEYIPSSAPFTATQWSIPVSNSLGFGNSILGGSQNRMYDSTLSSIMGGHNHFMETSLGSSIIGGGGNTITSVPGNTFGPNYSGIFVGLNNTITASGQLGNNNFFSGSKSVILGGENNLISGHTFASILGGYNNEIYTSAGYNAIIGGEFNKLGAGYSVILGGVQNTLGSVNANSFILGGEFNTILKTGSGLGVLNPAGLDSGGIIGGRNNTITGVTVTSNNDGGTILGGLNNKLLNTQSSNSMWYSGIILGADNTITSTQNTGGIGSSTASDGNLVSLIIGGQENSLTDSDRSLILGGYQNSLSNTKNSLILGGSGLTGNTDNTVYVPGLNINNAPGGVSIGSLQIDTNGNVITGTTLNVGGVGELCYLCNYVFTGDTGTTITIDEGITDVFVEEPTEGTATVECARCCTEWAYKYIDNSVNPPTPVYLTTTNFSDIKVVLGSEKFSSVKYKCISSNSTGSKETGVEHTVDVRTKTIPQITTEPTPIVGVDYTGFEATNTENVYLRDVYNVKILDSARVKVEQSTLVGVSGSSYSTVENSFNTMTYNSNGTIIQETHDSIIKDSNWSSIGTSKESTLDGNYTTILASNNVETQDTEGTAVIAAKDIVATQDYTLYTSSLYVDDKNGLNVNTLQVSAPVNSGCTFVVTSGGTVGVKTCDPDFDLEVNGSFGATSKSFVIPHPTKEGKKLVHGAIEGPEFGVYYRGKVKGKVIDLPEYWTELVDETTITVQLTAIGGAQNLYVEKIENNKVFINSSGWFSTPHCYYTVYGERKDIDKINLEIDA